MNVLALVVSFLLGALSAFSFFAMSFNGYPMRYQLLLLITVAIMSAGAGKSKIWNKLCLSFYIPHLPLFALLILGLLEKGGWMENLFLVFLPTLAIWLPAWIVHKKLKSYQRP